MRVVHPVLALHELVQACGSLKISDYFVIRCISIPIKTVEKGLVSEPWAFNLKILRVPSAGMPGLAVRGGLRLNQLPGKVTCVQPGLSWLRRCGAAPQRKTKMTNSSLGCFMEVDTGF